MGYRTEFNWVLKLKPEQGLDEKNLKEGKEYSFDKEEHRIYPINIPIHLINSSWETVGKVVVTEYTAGNSKTRGKYRVLRVYGKAEREILTGNIRENAAFVTGRTDYKNLKMT